MNATVATMLRLVMLENSLSAECKCEGTHPYYQCSGEVTHLLTSCVSGRRPRMVCQNTANYTYAVLRNPARVFCSDCYKPTDTCWKIRPI